MESDMKIEKEFTPATLTVNLNKICHDFSAVF